MTQSKHTVNKQTRPGLDPQMLVGKTITAVDNTAFNTFDLTFSDGTKVSIDTERGPLGIPGLVLWPPETDEKAA